MKRVVSIFLSLLCLSSCDATNRKTNYFVLGTYNSTKVSEISGDIIDYSNKYSFKISISTVPDIISCNSLYDVVAKKYFEINLFLIKNNGTEKINFNYFTDTCSSKKELAAYKDNNGNLICPGKIDEFGKTKIVLLLIYKTENLEIELC